MPASPQEKNAAAPGNADGPLERIARSPRSLWMVLVGFALLGAIASFRVPLYQGFDEGWHYAYVEHWALGRGLPNLNAHFLSGDPSAPYWQTHEASQPPLYYMLLGGLVSLVPRGDLMQEQLLESSAPNGMYGNFLPADRGALGSGHVLAGHLARLATVLMGTVVVACAYFITLSITRSPATSLLVAAMTGFNPRIITLTAQISNDMAVACAASLTLLLATRFVLDDDEPRIFLALLLGVGTGVSLLLKYSGGVVVLAAVAGVLTRAIRLRRSWRWVMAQTVVIGAGALAVTGWYFLRNHQLYGDALAWNKVNEMNAALATPRTIQEMIGLIPFILKFFFGHPAYPLIVADRYGDVMLYLMVPAVIGVAWLAAKRRIGLGYIPILVALGANFVAYYPWLRDHDATQNMRFFSPTFVPITLLYCAGLLAFTPRRWRAGIAIAVSVTYAAFTSITLVAGFNQMFAFPAYLNPAESAAALARPPTGRVVFENGIELIDAQIGRSRVDSGNPFDLTLIWRATQPITTNAHLTLDLRDEQDRTIAALNTGNVVRYGYVPRAWTVGALVRESYTFRPATAGNSVLRILAGWYAQDGRTSAIKPVGSGAVSVEVGRVKVKAEASPPGPTSVLARFEGLAELTGLERGADRVVVRIRAISEPSQNYTLFVHGLDESGSMIAQRDTPFEPSAATWTFGEPFEQVLPAPGIGRAITLRIGAYDSATQQRLPAFRPDGSRWPDDLILLSAP